MFYLTHWPTQHHTTIQYCSKHLNIIQTDSITFISIQIHSIPINPVHVTHLIFSTRWAILFTHPIFSRAWINKCRSVIHKQIFRTCGIWFILVRCDSPHLLKMWSMLSYSNAMQMTLPMHRKFYSLDCHKEMKVEVASMVDITTTVPYWAQFLACETSTTHVSSSSKSPATSLKLRCPAVAPLFFIDAPSRSSATALSRLPTLGMAPLPNLFLAIANVRSSDFCNQGPQSRLRAKSAGFQSSQLAAEPPRA